MIDRSNYRYEFPVSIRFTDIDTMRHVNNAAYFTFLEEARLHYWRDVVGASVDDSLLFIIAHSECDYKRPILLTEQTKVLIRVSRMGNKSFDFRYAVVVEEGDQEVLAAEAMTVQVMFDYSVSESVRIPDRIRQTLRDFEPVLA